MKKAVFSLEKEEYKENLPNNLLNRVTKSGKRKIPVGKIGKLPHWKDASKVLSWERKTISSTWEEFFKGKLI